MKTPGDLLPRLAEAFNATLEEPIPTRVYRDVFIDMDGPLVDFVGGVPQLFGGKRLIPQDYRGCYYDWWRNVGLDCHKTLLAMTSDNWANLTTSEAFSEVLGWARKSGMRVSIITQPAEQAWEASCVGKMEWLARECSGDLRRVILSGDKAAYAHSDAVLLDDNPDHVRAFIAAGGNAFLFPTFYNWPAQQELPVWTGR